MVQAERAHQLVRVYGRDEGLKRAADEIVDPKLVDIVRRFYEADSSDAGISYAGFCILNLPRRRRDGDLSSWERTLHRPDFSCSLSVEPGKLMVEGQNRTFGVPFGSAARILLIYMQREALLNRSRQIELGSSMYGWLKHVGFHVGGSDYRRVRDQLLRIAACSLRFTWGEKNAKGDTLTAFKKDTIVESGVLVMTERGDQRQYPIWQDHIVLSNSFYEEIVRRPVPVDLAAIAALNQSPFALDVYCWLAYRLHVLERETLCAWGSLKEQFGPDYSRARQFREAFREAIEAALCAYPGARVTIDDRGVTLHPSPAPVRDMALGRRASLKAIEGSAPF